MNHDSYDDSYIRGILNTVKTIAMVGVSAKTSRPSYFAFKYLLERGYRMIPVNPGLAGQELLGQKVYAKLADIPEPVDMVDIFRASQYALAIVAGGARAQAAPAGDLDAARRPQRRGREARRGERPQGGDEPLPEDRIWPPVLRDRLDGRQHPHPDAKKAQLFGRGIQRMALNRATIAGGATDATMRAQKARPRRRLRSRKVDCGRNTIPFDGRMDVYGGAVPP